MKKNILIIENQKSEFELISKYLSDYESNSEKQYNSFPLDDDYSTFMDNIQVLINNDYSDKYQQKAKEYLKEFIETKSIDIILMDFILAGQHCKTGVELAITINDLRKADSKDVIPICFFSKTVLNDERRSEKEENYKRKFNLFNWIPKGFFGYEHLEKDYFENKVIKEGIRKLLQEKETKQQMHLDKLK
jgi:CheY-like chemotaxis protein